MKFRYLGDLRIEGAQITTDAPKENGGKGEYPSPTDLFAASLATCMLTLMGIAARKLGADLQGMTAEVEKEMKPGPSRIGKMVIRIRCALSPSTQIREKLERAAIDCPVRYSIHPDIKVETDFVWGL